MSFDLSWSAVFSDLIMRIVSDLMAIVGFSDLSWGVAIIGTGIFVIGLALEELGKYLSRRAKTRTGQILMVRPCTGLGYVFMGIAALIIILNMAGPIINQLWKLLFQN